LKIGRFGYGIGYGPVSFQRRAIRICIALVMLVALLSLPLLALAWRDGGREPVREIMFPVAVPEVPPAETRR